MALIRLLAVAVQFTVKNEYLIFTYTFKGILDDENVEASSGRTLTVSDRYAATARSKSIAMFSALDPLTKVATTRLGSTFHTPTLGWSTITVLTTLSAASKTGNKARKEAILMTTCV